MNPIVGRDQELALAGAFVDGLGDGPRALLLEGEAGIGKTALWRAALAAAEAAGRRVLRCVAEPAEARLSFVGLGDLANGLADEHLAALPGPQREALEVALVRPSSGSGRAPDPTAVGGHRRRQRPRTGRWRRRDALGRAGAGHGPAGSDDDQRQRGPQRHPAAQHARRQGSGHNRSRRRVAHHAGGRSGADQ